jgi:hypothetical protein
MTYNINNISISGEIFVTVLGAEAEDTITYRVINTRSFLVKSHVYHGLFHHGSAMVFGGDSTIAWQCVNGVLEVTI